MQNLIILFVVVAVLAAVIWVLKEIKGGGRQKEKSKNEYEYARKQFFMTRAEHEFYDALVEVVGEQYYIFAQVHLPSIVDYKVKGQNWSGAFSHINQKSVDFVLCGKKDISPKLAIELDDSSHEREDRKERDVEVERILQQAGLPLLRLENIGSFNPSELAEKIYGKIGV